MKFNEVNVWIGSQCHWSSTQPGAPQPPVSPTPSLCICGWRPLMRLIICNMKIISWGALVELGLPSVQSLPFKLLGWRSWLYREAVGFLACGFSAGWSFLLKCSPAVYFFHFLCLEEGFVILMCIFHTFVFTFSIGWIRQLRWKNVLNKIKYAWNLKLGICFVRVRFDFESFT